MGNRRSVFHNLLIATETPNSALLSVFFFSYICFDITFVLASIAFIS